MYGEALVRREYRVFVHYDRMREVWSWIRSYLVFFSSDQWSRRVVVWKRRGETPLEAIHRLRKKGVFVRGRRRPIPPAVPIAYAGRLDPMAEGVLLLLIGEECKAVAQYREKDKEYVVDVLFGCATDTGDALGCVTRTASPFQLPTTNDAWNVVLKECVGEHEWAYPVFSSKTVQGKPLFKWRYEGAIDQIVVPTRHVRIDSLVIEEMGSVSIHALLSDVQSRIHEVTKVDDADKSWGNDFRREEVLARWHTVCAHAHEKEYAIITVRCRCAAGTYMRTLAEKIGERVGAPAFAFHITRTHIF